MMRALLFLLGAEAHLLFSSGERPPPPKTGSPIYPASSQPKRIDVDKSNSTVEIRGALSTDANQTWLPISPDMLPPTHVDADKSNSSMEIEDMVPIEEMEVTSRDLTVDVALSSRRNTSEKKNCSFSAFSDLVGGKGLELHVKTLRDRENNNTRRGGGRNWEPRRDQPLARKVAFIIPVSLMRFPYLLEFHKQIQSCTPFRSQADVFVGFNSAGEMKKYWEEFRSLSSWQRPSDWQRSSNGQGFREQDNRTTEHGSLPSCMDPTTDLCEESGITSAVVPKDQFTKKVVWRAKKFWLAAWVLSKRPGYRFLALLDSELRITDCSIFEKQSLLGAVEASHANKIWTGSPCQRRTCSIQRTSARAVANGEEELAGLERAGATCAFTWQNEFPWVEATSFTAMLQALGRKYNVGISGKENILEIVRELNRDRAFKEFPAEQAIKPCAQIMYHMWMVLHHEFRVLHRERSCSGELSESECRNPPARMDWAPMWTLSKWCHKYDSPSSRKPFLFFDLDHELMDIPEKYLLHREDRFQPVRNEIHFDYMAYFKDHHVLYPPPNFKGKPCF